MLRLANIDKSSWLCGNFSRPPTEAGKGMVGGPIVPVPEWLTGQAYLTYPWDGCIIPRMMC